MFNLSISVENVGLIKHKQIKHVLTSINPTTLNKIEPTKSNKLNISLQFINYLHNEMTLL